MNNKKPPSAVFWYTRIRAWRDPIFVETVLLAGLGEVKVGPRQADTIEMLIKLIT